MPDQLPLRRVGATEFVDRRAGRPVVVGVANTPIVVD